ncbi:MAG TPA: hypothetical protein PLD88_08310, partial [Candidatus Berkiella sp.]|nr:hypothetical protein [Candidatus Berkiella sp.]
DDETVDALFDDLKQGAAGNINEMVADTAPVMQPEELKPALTVNEELVDELLADFDFETVVPEDKAVLELPPSLPDDTAVTQDKEVVELSPQIDGVT